MAAFNRKDRVRLVWPGELDGLAGTVRRRFRRVRKPDGTATTGYSVVLDKPTSDGLTKIHAFEDRIEPIDGGAR